MNKFSLIFLFMSGYMCFAQQLFGVVTDGLNREPIPGAKIELKELQVATYTKNDGSFSLEGDWPETLTLQVSSATYESKVLSISCCDLIEVVLYSDPHNMEEVMVRVERRELQGSMTQKTDYIELDKLNVISPMTITEALTQIDGVQMASYGPLNAKPVIRGMQGMRVVTFLNGMRINNQQWGGDHGLGISQAGMESAEVIKGPMSLIYTGDATGGLLYLKDGSFAAQNSYSVDVNTQFETASLGSQNSVVYKLSGKKLRMSAAGIFSSYADYKLPNGRFLSDSRMQDLGGKFKLGYNSGKWNFVLNYLYSNSTVGIPGHTHDVNPLAESFMVDYQERDYSLPHQKIENHFGNIKASYFINSKNKMEFYVNHGYNNLAEYAEKIFTPAIDMYLNSSSVQARHHWNPNKRLQLLSGIQTILENNENGLDAEERLIEDSDQYDLGLYSSLSYDLKGVKLNAVLRFDNRSIRSADFSGDYPNVNAAFGLRKQWEGESIKDLSAHLSSGTRAPHLSELLSDGVHHGAVRYELGDPNLKSERFVQLDINYEFSNEHFSLMFNPYATYANGYIQLAQVDSVIDGMEVYEYAAKDGVLLYGLETRVHYHPHFDHRIHFETGYSNTFGRDLGIVQSGEDLYFMPQARLRSNVRIELFKNKAFGFASVIVQHNYFFNQDRVGPLETATDAYHLLQLGCQMKWDSNSPVQLSFGVRNALNTSYINHMSSLKSLGLKEPGRSFYFNLKWNINGRNQSNK
ncbi:MAG: TonB-dependent receptor [Crocinitomicaceae bacterium]|nr:TonB-dependent receptor [Crocinitomicaceae bacterium]MDG1735043.1 TonB-dependent receptor [Crocinitomicaceae bacterium]